MVVDFEDVGGITCGSPDGDVTTLSAGGFSFSSADLFGCKPGFELSFLASSGSAYLGTQARNVSGPFELVMAAGPGITFDLAGFRVSDLLPFLSGGTAFTVKGTLAAGGAMVMSSFNTDPAGSAPHFEPFGGSLAAFKGLTEVRFLAATEFGIDDIGLQNITDTANGAPLPSPAPLLLAGSGLLLLGATARRRHRPA